MTLSIVRRLTISALLVAAPLSAAVAADMPVKAKAPAAPPFSWTGLYIGGYAGAAWADQSTTSDPCLVGVDCTASGTGTYNGLAPISYDMNPSFTGGGTIGYNWQINPYTVLGVENNFGYLHVHGSYVANSPPLGDGDTSYNATIGNWYDAYTARVGIVDGHVMFYLKAGGATARYTEGVVDNGLPVTINTTASKTKTGLAAGGGVEYAIDSHWSVKAEYLVLGVATTLNSCAQVGGFPAGTIDCAYTHISSVQTIDLGLNYRF